MKIDEETLNEILTAQENEITEYFIYNKIASGTKNPHNREILLRLSKDELTHYNFWKEYSGKDVKPRKLKIWKYFLASKIFGLTFGVKLMENGEKKAQEVYENLSKKIPDARSILKDEEEHEEELIALIDEERLRYVGSIVLGLNDALVELTGAIAGLTFVLQNTRLIALAGMITGVAASLSMASSEYLSTKMEGDKSPFRASFIQALHTFSQFYFCFFHI